MSGNQISKAAQDVIYLVKCVVNEKIPDTDKLSDTDEIYTFAARHKLSAAVAMALESAGLKDSRSTAAIAGSLKRMLFFEKALAQVKSELEKNNIRYMPLKGIIMKDLYPKAGMREMADHDILFDEERADDVKEIMESIGFRTEHFDIGNHDCYYKLPCLNFEMHRALFGESHEEKLYEYYKNVWNRLLGYGLEKHFSPEDFYIFMIVHKYKHYSGGGTGLRSLVDTYVYLQKHALNMEYMIAEIEKLGIADFEVANRSLAQHLLSGDELTVANWKMLDYILTSGTYGTLAHSVENKMRKNGYGKIRYAMSRFFVPISRKNKNYALMAGYYPFFYKHRILLPILPFYRTFRAMKNGKFKAEAKAIKSTKI